MTTQIHRPSSDPSLHRLGASAPPSERCIICCGGSSRRFQVSSIWIRQCDSCGHQFAEMAGREHDVQQLYGDDYFSQGGAGYSDYLSESSLLIHRARRYASRVARHAKPGTMLDVGAAAGFTLRGFADAGWDVLGIEPNAKMADFARSQMHVAVETTALEALTSGHRFDLVTMLQVLPHFANPRAAIQQAARLLRPGGHLLIETWNRQSWTARLLGQGWHEYSPPSVLHWFSNQTLTRLLESEGFALIDQGRPTRWIGMGHAKSVLRSKANLSLTYRMLLGAASVSPDRLAVPYPCDDLIWMLLRLGDIKQEVAAPDMAQGGFVCD
jgi:SAM-dependent methyltransferase